jgi:hypothetical protein
MWNKNIFEIVSCLEQATSRKRNPVIGMFFIVLIMACSNFVMI